MNGPWVPGLDSLLTESGAAFEDLFYRFYHHSFKVYRLQRVTEKLVEALQSLAPDRALNPWFLEILGGERRRALGVADVALEGDPDALVACNNEWAETSGEAAGDALVTVLDAVLLAPGLERLPERESRREAGLAIGLERPLDDIA